MSRKSSAWIATAVLCCGFSCSNEQEPNRNAVAAPSWSAVVSQQLELFHGEGLPLVTQEDQDEVLDLLDLSISTDKGRRKAYQVFADSEADWLTSVMLSIVEGRDAHIELKTEAYNWLGHSGVEAMVPRLCLRLKYEKDWTANVDIAMGLLRYGCGAGLEPLIIILRTEEGIEDLDRARWSAIASLKSLPAKPGWIPGDNFDDDWKRLIEVEEIWRTTHLLPDSKDSQQPSRAYRAEIWTTLAKLRSQRLRPVDDARYVLMRQPTWAFQAIVETAYDEDRYVKEHALQTIAWIGAPIGLWAERTDFDLALKLTPLLGDGRLRGRVLEAMGASGMSTMQDSILLWLREGNLEESTAAADALLRCANQDVLRPIEAFLASKPYQSPEGNYALQCLRKSLDEGHKLSIPDGIDPSEIARRDRWAAQRKGTP